MTKAQFVDKWKGRLTVLGIYGLALDTQYRVKGEFGARDVALKMPDSVDKMIEELLADMRAMIEATKPKEK